jgi:adenylate cyclase
LVRFLALWEIGSYRIIYMQNGARFDVIQTFACNDMLNSLEPTHSKELLSLAQMRNSTVEIERKFKLLAPPPLLQLGLGVEIIQGYILVEPTELRLRQKEQKWFLTAKSDGSLLREEWETEIPESVFQALWPATGNRRLHKVRYRIPHGELVLELDEYRNNLAGLYVLECEFPTSDAARLFTLPLWASTAVEITSDPSFKISALLRRSVENA